MQWNLTGLCGATRAEELINVWGPAGVICTFVDIRGSRTGALVVLNIEQMLLWTARHLRTKAPKRHYRRNERCHHFHSSFHYTHTHTHTHTHWQSDPPSTPPVIQSVCPHVLPAFWWWTASGRTNLPLQPFPPQLPGNIIKRGRLSGPRARCLAPTPLRLSSAATLQSCFHKWFIPLSGWLLHHPPHPLCSRHADERYTQMTWRGTSPAQNKTTYSQNGASAAFCRGCEITDVCQELS